MMVEPILVEAQVRFRLHASIEGWTPRLVAMPRIVDGAFLSAEYEDGTSKNIRLFPAEAWIFEYIASRYPEIVLFEEIKKDYDRLFRGSNHDFRSAQIVYVQMNRLRRRIKGAGVRIRTVERSGYMLEFVRGGDDE